MKCLRNGCVMTAQINTPLLVVGTHGVTDIMASFRNDHTRGRARAISDDYYY